MPLVHVPSHTVVKQHRSSTQCQKLQIKGDGSDEAEPLQVKGLYKTETFLIPQ